VTATDIVLFNVVKRSKKDHFNHFTKLLAKKQNPY